MTATRHRRRASCVFFCGHKNVMITRCCHTQRQYQPPRSMHCGARGLGTVTSINTSPNCQLRARESPHVLHLVYLKLSQWTLSLFSSFQEDHTVRTMARARCDLPAIGWRQAEASCHSDTLSGAPTTEENDRQSPRLLHTSSLIAGTFGPSTDPRSAPALSGHRHRSPGACDLSGQT